MPASRPVFAIFQGGGAAGIAHLGAAAAAEEEGLEFAGVAGASAGAFVAALLAAGYRGKELFNPEARGSDLLSRYNASPLDLLDTTRWQEVLQLRHAAQRAAGLVKRPRWKLGWLWLGWRLWRLGRRHAGIIARDLDEKGHFDTAGVREFVNWAIREKLRDAYAEAGLPAGDVPDRVCFKHLDVNRFPRFRPLKIIATDVQAGQAALFCQDRASADVEIAATVAASIAIPGFFQPVRLPGIGSTLFADGGLVSNLPAWAFLEDKLAYERRFPDEDRVPIVAFILAEPDESGATQRQTGTQSLPSYVAAVIRAGVFGSQAIGQRLVTDLVPVELRPSLGVLGFDAGWSDILDCFNAGRRDAKRAFACSLRLRPDRVRAELKATVEGFDRRIRAAALRDGAILGRLRGAIVAPAGSASLRVMITSGTQTEADDNLLLDRNGPGCAACFRDRDIKVVSVTHDAFGRPLFSPAALMTRYEAAQLWRDLRSMICVPIFADSSDWSLEPTDRHTDPIGVLSIDSDTDLAQGFIQEDSLDWLADRSVVLSQILEKGNW
jgi:predicted acylesterase/phospholipase RssA